eukprot:gene17985-21474_t
MADLYENPMGLMGFEFIEFASPTPGTLEPIFEIMGFTKVATHRSKNVHLYRQGEINLILNNEPNSIAYNRALELGAQPIHIETGPMELNLPAIKGIGGAPLYLIDRFGEGSSIYDIDFVYLEGVERNPVGAGLKVIDHLTHNVYRGRMAYWANFYEKLFNFQSSKGAGQIEEFLMQFNGEGIQHVAFLTDDLVKTWDALKKIGMRFMTAPPDTYYEMLEGRLPNHGEPVDQLQARGILLDGSSRKGDDGFGEGNFKALFESIERDQPDRDCTRPGFLLPGRNIGTQVVACGQERNSPQALLIIAHTGSPPPGLNQAAAVNDEPAISPLAPTAPSPLSPATVARVTFSSNVEWSSAQGELTAAGGNSFFEFNNLEEMNAWLKEVATDPDKLDVFAGHFSRNAPADQTKRVKDTMTRFAAGDINAVVGPFGYEKGDIFNRLDKHPSVPPVPVNGLTGTYLKVETRDGRVTFAGTRPDGETVLYQYDAYGNFHGGGNKGNFYFVKNGLNNDQPLSPVSREQYLKTVVSVSLDNVGANDLWGLFDEFIRQLKNPGSGIGTALIALGVPADVAQSIEKIVKNPVTGTLLELNHGNRLGKLFGATKSKAGFRITGPSEGGCRKRL